MSLARSATARNSLTLSRVIGLIGLILLIIGAARLLHDLGSFPPEGRDWVLAAIGLLLGVRVTAYAPDEPMGWLLLAVGVAEALTIFTSAWESSLVVLWVRDWVWVVSWMLLPLIVIHFRVGGPEERPPWRLLVWVGWAGVFLTVVGLAGAAAGDPWGYFRNDDQQLGHLSFLGVLFLAGLAFGMAALIGGIINLGHRARRSSGRQRRSVLFALFASSALALAAVLEARGLPMVWIAAALALPVAAVWTIVRYGLFDIDLIIHRSLLFGILSLGILVLYWAAVVIAVREAPAQSSLIAAAVAVIAVHPLREALQQMLDTLLYGVRSRPYVAIDTLGAQLQAESSGAQTLQVVVGSIAHSLKLPYVALVSNDVTVPPVQCGAARNRPLVTLPLTHQGLDVGELRVGTRSPDERLTRSEMSTLEAVSLQAGAAVYAVGLAKELQRARESLVLTREEERRRLRRDLHDGLGPSLAGMTMQVGTAKLYLSQGGSTASAATLLDQVEREMVQVNSEIRRLVRGLRPPALDERGLVAAIQETVAGFVRAKESSLKITLSADGIEHGGLPAAVELAAFRIAVEAATNCARHANATSCAIVLQQTSDHVQIEVSDDGSGVHLGRQEGMGTLAMRERAAELGGLCIIHARDGGGTVVSARIPLYKSRLDGGNDSG